MTSSSLPPRLPGGSTNLDLRIFGKVLIEIFIILARGVAVDGYSELIQTNEKRLPLNFLDSSHQSLTVHKFTTSAYL